MERVWIKFQITNFTMLNNFSSMTYALESVPSLVHVGVFHGDRDGPRTPLRYIKGVWKKFQMTLFDMSNNVFSMKNALKSVPGLADVGVPHEDCP